MLIKRVDRYRCNIGKFCVFLFFSYVSTQYNELSRCPINIFRNKYLRQYGNNCYEFVRIETYNDDAQFDCERRGGTLIHVLNAGTQEFVMKTLKDLRWPFRAIWIGATDSVTENDWRWTDDSKLEYTNWGRRQPSCGFMCNEDCAIIRYDKDGLWYAKPCRSRMSLYGYICQYNKSPLPKTTTLKPSFSTLKPISKTTKRAAKIISLSFSLLNNITRAIKVLKQNKLSRSPVSENSVYSSTTECVNNTTPLPSIIKRLSSILIDFSSNSFKTLYNVVTSKGFPSVDSLKNQQLSNFAPKDTPKVISSNMLNKIEPGVFSIQQSSIQSHSDHKARLTDIQHSEIHSNSDYRATLTYIYQTSLKSSLDYDATLTDVQHSSIKSQHKHVTLNDVQYLSLTSRPYYDSTTTNIHNHSMQSRIGYDSTLMDIQNSSLKSHLGFDASLSNIQQSSPNSREDYDAKLTDIRHSSLKSRQDCDATLNTIQHSSLKSHHNYETTLTTIPYSSLKSHQDYDATLTYVQHSTSKLGHDYNATVANSQHSSLISHEDYDVSLTTIQHSSLKSRQDYGVTLTNIQHSLIVSGQDYDATLTNIQYPSLKLGQDYDATLTNIQHSSVKTGGHYDATPRNSQHLLLKSHLTDVLQSSLQSHQHYNSTLKDIKSPISINSSYISLSLSLSSNFRLNNIIYLKQFSSLNFSALGTFDQPIIESLSYNYHSNYLTTMDSYSIFNFPISKSVKHVTKSTNSKLIFGTEEITKLEPQTNLVYQKHMTFTNTSGKYTNIPGIFQNSSIDSSKIVVYYGKTFNTIKIYNISATNTVTNFKSSPNILEFTRRFLANRNFSFNSLIHNQRIDQTTQSFVQTVKPATFPENYRYKSITLMPLYQTNERNIQDENCIYTSASLKEHDNFSTDIVIGSVCGILLILCLIFFCYLTRRRHRKKEETAQENILNVKHGLCI